jgi:hypothetical protein
MAKSIIDRISNSCSCSREEAEEYLESEVQNLRELMELGDLRSGDMETACQSLGLENDYIEYFINVLAYQL